MKNGAFDVLRKIVWQAIVDANEAPAGESEISQFNIKLPLAADTEIRKAPNSDESYSYDDMRLLYVLHSCFAAEGLHLDLTYQISDSLFALRLSEQFKRDASIKTPSSIGELITPDKSRHYTYKNTLPRWSVIEYAQFVDQTLSGYLKEHDIGMCLQIFIRPQDFEKVRKRCRQFSCQSTNPGPYCEAV